MRLTLIPAVRRWSPAAVGVLVIGAVFALPLAGSRGSAAIPKPSTAATKATAPVSAPVAAPAVASRRPPAPGEARLVAGPFTDRLRLQQVSLQGGVMRGSFAQVADNSAVLVMEVQGDFYDARGALLGSRRTVLRQPDVVRSGRGGTGTQRYGGDIVFTVAAAPAWSARAAGVLLSVPTLVNE